MNYKIAGSIVVIVGFMAAIGSGAFAFFTDVEESSGNTFRAGSLNIALDSNNDDDFSVSLTDMKPGKWYGPKRLDINNVGSLTAVVDNIVVKSVSQNDVNDGIAANTPDTRNVGPNEFDDQVHVKIYKGGHPNNPVYTGTIEDMKTGDTLRDWDGDAIGTETTTLSPGSAGSYKFKFKLDLGVSDDFQHDGIDVTFEVQAVQEGQES